MNDAFASCDIECADGCAQFFGGGFFRGCLVDRVSCVSNPGSHEGAHGSVARCSATLDTQRFGCWHLVPFQSGRFNVWIGLEFDTQVILYETISIADVFAADQLMRLTEATPGMSSSLENSLANWSRPDVYTVKSTLVLALPRSSPEVMRCRFIFSSRITPHRS